VLRDLLLGLVAGAAVTVADLALRRNDAPVPALSDTDSDRSRLSVSSFLGDDGVEDEDEEEDMAAGPEEFSDLGEVHFVSSLFFFLSLDLGERSLFNRLVLELLPLEVEDAFGASLTFSRSNAAIS